MGCSGDGTTERREVPGPLRERRLGPLRLTLWPPDHPTADVEVAVTIAGVVVVLALLLLPLERLAALLPACTFHRWTGHPCPTCGTTRVVLAVAHGRLREALSTNPLVAAVLAGLALWTPVAACQWLCRRPRWRIGLATPRARWLAAAAVAAAILLDWAFLVYRGI